MLADDGGLLPLIGDDDGGELWPIVGRPANDVAAGLAVAAALVDRSDLLIGAVPEEAYWILSNPRLAPALETQAAVTSHHRPQSGALPDTGYYISRSPAGDHLVVDGGPHGYQNGGHAHADALSLTFSRRGVPMLIDPGTSCYTTDLALRDRMRSTALHNTLVLDSRSQSIPDGPFHWSHTAGSRALRWRINSAFDYFAGVHDGYAPVEHRRHVLMLHGDLLIVADLVSGSDEHTAAVHWHVDPAWSVRPQNNRVELQSAAGRCELLVPSGALDTFAADAATGLGWHAPVYGQLLPSTTIRVTAAGPAPLWIVSVIGLDADNPVDGVELIPVTAPPGTLAYAVGVRIHRNLSCDELAIAEAGDHAGGSWRLGAIETDAHLLFCRRSGSGPVHEVALVDGSFVHAPNGGPRVTLETRVTDLYLDNLCAA
jgi:hypothetical protein